MSTPVSPSSKNSPKSPWSSETAQIVPRNLTGHLEGDGDHVTNIDGKSGPSPCSASGNTGSEFPKGIDAAWESMTRACADMPGAAMRRDRPQLRARTVGEVAALEALFRKAQQLGVQPNGRVPLDRLDDLYDLYRQHTPAVIRERNVMRTIRTLETLMDYEISPATLSNAVRNAAIRDFLAQMSAGLIGYGGSWFAGTTVALTMVTQGFGLPASVLFSSLTTAVGARLMTRWLRLSDAGPTWRRAISGADDKNTGVPAIRSWTGFGLASVAYWPFLATLCAITQRSPHPARADNMEKAAAKAADILNARRYLNFAATAGVAAHRYLSPHVSRYLSPFPLDVEHVWLDGTHPQRLIGAIDDLATLDLVWPAIRGADNLLSGLGRTLVPWPYDMAEAINARRDSKAPTDLEAAKPGPGSVASAPSPDRPGKDSMILFSLFTVVAATGLLRALASDPDFAGHTEGEPDRMTTHPRRLEFFADTFLVLAWGVAMAGADLVSGSIDSIAADNQRVAAQRNERLEEMGRSRMHEFKSRTARHPMRHSDAPVDSARDRPQLAEADNPDGIGPPSNDMQPAVPRPEPGERRQ